MSKASEAQRYLLALGEMMAAFLKLETAVRRYLYRRENSEAGEDWNDVSRLAYKMALPETAFTSGDSFGLLVQRYNACFTTQSSRRKYVIDDGIVSTRNTLAHGRVFPRGPHSAPALVNFTPRKKQAKNVFIAAVIYEPAEWVAHKLPKITAQLARVQAATKQLPPQR